MSAKTLVTALTVSTMLVGGVAFAAEQAQQTSAPPAGHKAVVKDFSKLSADGVRAYQDLTLARLAIFDGRTAAAKKYVDDADKGFDKAKSDESVFTQAEATMRSHSNASNNAAAGAADGSKMASSDKMASKDEGSNSSSSASSSSSSSSNSSSSGQSDVNTPIAWLPVDGTVTINEDYTLNPAKSKAVADANKSLAKGDKKGAMDKLKLAEVNTAVSLAVVPLQQTIKDVDQAKSLIDSGKFYEGSQKLRAVQDATVYTIADMPAVPVKAMSQSGSQPKEPSATH